MFKDENSSLFHINDVNKTSLSTDFYEYDITLLALMLSLFLLLLFMYFCAHI